MKTEQAFNRKFEQTVSLHRDIFSLGNQETRKFQAFAVGLFYIINFYSLVENYKFLLNKLVEKR